MADIIALGVEGLLWFVAVVATAFLFLMPAIFGRKGK